MLYAFITYIRQFFQPINAITQQWNTLQSASVSMDRIWKLFQIQPDLPNNGNASFPLRKSDGAPDIQGGIEFRDITFGYEKSQPVLRRLNLSIDPGERIGIVGTTGAGKSSLISLLCRFYDVQEGASISTASTSAASRCGRCSDRWACPAGALSVLWHNRRQCPALRHPITARVRS